MFERAICPLLKNWQNSNTRLPLLLQGARQVGKSHLIRVFGQICFEHLLELNFEERPELKACFNTLRPDQIIHQTHSNQVGDQWQ